MSPRITEVELTVVREKFQVLVDDLVKAGLHDSNGNTAKRKVLVYALKRIGAVDTSVVSNAQWGKFFQQVDGLRFDLPGLARYIDSLPVPLPVPEPTPAFSATDLEMLHDAGISARADSRQQIRYWKQQTK